MIFLLTWTPGAGFRDALKQAARKAAAGYSALYDSNSLLHTADGKIIQNINRRRMHNKNSCIETA